MLFLFDFDQTLVSARAVVPRQTRHALQLLVLAGHEIGIVTNNALAPLVLTSLGLPPLHCLVRASRAESHPALVQRWLDHFAATNPTQPFCYFDDLADQAEAVAAAFAFGQQQCHGSHVVADIQCLSARIAAILKTLHCPP